MVFCIHNLQKIDIQNLQTFRKTVEPAEFDAVASSLGVEFGAPPWWERHQMSDAACVQKISLDTNSFDELCASVEDWDQEYFQASPGAFSGSLDMTMVGSTHFIRERWGRRLHYRGTTPDGAYGFAIPISMPGPANWIGHQMTKDSVMIQSPGRAADFLGCEDIDVLELSVPEDDVRRIVSVLSFDDNFAHEYHEFATLKPYNAEALRRLGVEFLSLPDPVTEADVERYAQFSEQFVKLFLWELVKSRQDPELAVGHTKSAKIVRRATDYVLSEPNDRIGLTDICEKLNVSLRALHYAFGDVTGQSPANWLRHIRLNRVHKTLQISSPDDTLIKQVALDNGFLHLGHFTGQYQRFFGRLPSETLRSV